MSEHAYQIEVKSDFLEKITRASPTQALAEFVWNALDADATEVVVHVEFNPLGAMSAIEIADNGTGMPFSEAPELFTSLGGSWKRPGAVTKKQGRQLHGQDGRGRFKAFALGRVAEWDVTYDAGKELFSYKVTMFANSMREVRIADETPAPAGSRPGVVVRISELHKNYQALTAESDVQELTELLALYLTDYKDIRVQIAGAPLDPGKFIASRSSVSLADIIDESKNYEARLEIIEWRSATQRALYLCTEKGFPLLEVERRFHVGSFQFSAYLRSPYVTKMQSEGALELAEMNPAVVPAIDEAQQRIKSYFLERAAKEARSVVDTWKDENIYPYEGEARTNVEQVERKVFDIVAVNVAHYLPDFAAQQPKNKAWHLRSLRLAIEKSPEELQLILGEVLNLPKRRQEELAELLRDVSLSSIIGAAKVVADRLRLIEGLGTILFDDGTKQRLKERSQLHRIIAENCWLFGEEFNLSVDDRSLTEVLRKHRKLLGDDVAIDEPVKHISKDRGVIDLMLSRAMRRHRANGLTHLIVELKAPKVKVDKDAVTQIEEYAISVMKDERFKSITTTWNFWVISDDYGDYAAHRMKKDSGGQIHEDGNSSIYVKTWAQVIDENRARLQFFQEKLEYQADKGASLKHLQEHYAKYLEGVIEDEATENEAAAVTAKAK